jgi:hypothetical protein
MLDNFLGFAFRLYPLGDMRRDVERVVKLNQVVLRSGFQFSEGVVPQKRGLTGKQKGV